MVQGQLRLREQVGPAIGREGDVARRENGDEVVFGSADGPLCRKGAVILRGGVLEREEDVGTTVVGGGRREVKAASAVLRPRLAV